MEFLLPFPNGSLCTRVQRLSRHLRGGLPVLMSYKAHTHEQVWVRSRKALVKGTSGSDLPDPQKDSYRGTGLDRARGPLQSFISKSTCLILQGCQSSAQEQRQGEAERQKEGSEKLCTFITKSDLTAPGDGEEQTSKNTLLLTVFK